MTEATEEPQWFDLAFDVTTFREVTDPDRVVIEARGQSDVGVAGFGVELERSDWQRDAFSSDIWFDWGRGAIFSIGSESDHLAHLLSGLIGDGSAGRFVDRLDCDVVLLNSEPDNLLSEYIRSKFFIGPADEAEAQVFVNFDLPAAACEFREKDFEFRSSLLRHLVVH
jgi:hypothetical protein